MGAATFPEGSARAGDLKERGVVLTRTTPRAMTGRSAAAEDYGENPSRIDLKTSGVDTFRSGETGTIVT